MLATLGAEGYEIEWRVVNSADYGFPQRRIRVFIVARRKKSGKKDPRQIILKTGILARALPVIKTDLDITEIDLSDEPEVISSKFNKGSDKSPFLTSGYFVDGIAYTLKTQAKEADVKQVLGDIILKDSQVPDEYWVPTSRLDDWRFLKGAKSIEREHKATGTKYNYAEGKMAFPDLLTNPSRTILTGEGGTTPSRFKHIIQTKRGWRRLTPVELERLNGFPDDWTKYDESENIVSDGKRAFFMGNALVVGLIAKVGKVIAKEMKSIK
jgi:DNA (cytosine-5)-methyltransferase 1